MEYQGGELGQVDFALVEGQLTVDVRTVLELLPSLNQASPPN